nr:immunoglobulin heavy chain junction region [Mus musculus]
CVRDDGYPYGFAYW